MKETTLILKPGNKSDLAPIVELLQSQIYIKSKDAEVYNYAISSKHGTVILKGAFEKGTSLQLDNSEFNGPDNIFQLDIFNANDHFVYNFRGF